MRYLVYNLIISICSINVGYAYIPLPEGGSVYKTIYYCPQPPISQFCFLIVDSLESDTLINSVRYTKVYRKTQDALCSTNILNPYAYFGAIRQDTLNRKVFFNSPSTGDQLLYDFSISMGDTIYSWFSICAPRVVTAVDQVTIQGQQRIRYKLEDIDQVCGGIFYLIEGVGATSGLTDPMASLGSILLCMSDSGNVVYRDSGYVTCNSPVDTCLAVNIPELTEEVYIVYPNIYPSTIKVELKTNLKFKASIYNVSGNLIQMKNVISECYFMDILPGVYVVSLQSDINVFNQKIIVK